jgi:cobalt-precorrin 5A hydrolase/precorrin-3B C17-methyltransferase
MGLASNPVLLALTADGAQLAARIRNELGAGKVHGLAGRTSDCDETFTETDTHLRGLFRDGRPVIGICATGILIRTLAQELSDKRTEPPVIAVSPDGASIVPLLGGHHGANKLAGRIAKITGGTAAITTAGETRFGIALDEPPPGWTVGNPDGAKSVMAALLDGAAPCLVIEAGSADWLNDLPLDADGQWMVRVTDRAIEANPRELLLHPPTLAVGVGCERGCSKAELHELVARTISDAGLAPESVTVVVSIDVKVDEPAVHDIAQHWGVPARFFAAEQLEWETPRLANPSAIVFREVGAHGVAEAAALAAAGPEGVLIVPKQKSARATCAVARGPNIDPQAVGMARGHLSIVGTGPGDQAYRIPATDAAVAAASELVGYGLYLDLLGPAAIGKTRHDFNLGAEEDRCRHALDLAAGGRNVALVSSGDPGVFAMAALVFELLDRADDPRWRRIAIDVHPGVSAMQLAAARAGAPLGHDFCAISLSDLLTPRETIDARLRAVAEADFVIALYNPASKIRRRQIETTRDMLLRHRPADTPVVVARNLARESESIEIVALADLRVETIDMLTVLIIGNAQSRALMHDGRAWTYTPRGYEKKRSGRNAG